MQDRTFWNEVAIFDESTRKHVEKRLAVGEYVRVEGTLRRSSYERDGEKVYTTELAVDQISRQPTKAAAASDPA